MFRDGVLASLLVLGSRRHHAKVWCSRTIIRYRAFQGYSGVRPSSRREIPEYGPVRRVVRPDHGEGIAALPGNQKRQDVRKKALGAYVDLLMSAAAATQEYVWYARSAVHPQKEIAQEDWDSARELFQPAYEAYSKVKYLGTALADESVRETYDRIVTALHSVLFAKESVKDAWHGSSGGGSARLHRRCEHRRQGHRQESVSRLSDRSAQLDHEAWDEEGNSSAPFRQR